MWTDWQDSAWVANSPYIDWWERCPPLEFETNQSPASMAATTLAPIRLDRFASIVRHTIGKDGLIYPPPKPVASLAEPGLHNLFPGVDDNFGDFADPHVPVPKDAANRQFEQRFAATGTWLPADAALPTIPLSTVIVGIIDSGIGLGNHRFRGPDGKTRVLAAWQQNASRIGAPAVPNLPFGTEVYAADIDGQIGVHTQDGFFDETAFNRFVGALDVTRPLGHRELAGRASHGTFVADMAAGAAPEDNETTRIIAVNLPDRATINNSGIFLDYFAIFGIKRIADLADRIWWLSLPAGERGAAAARPDKGFSIVINLAFGKNAGAKDGNDYFNWAVREINQAREAAGFRALTLVIPVGNHNLAQTNAVFDLAPGAETTVTFRTVPEDQSSNYLEIWAPEIPVAAGAPPQSPLAIAVRAPGETGPYMTSSVGPAGTSRGLAEKARLYSSIRPNPDKTRFRASYILCSGPTLQQSRDQRHVCASGDWGIAIRNVSDTPVHVQFSVQTDQSNRPGSNTGLMPRLTTVAYRRYDDAGRFLDSYPYPTPSPASSTEPVTGVRRHGSINATAMSDGIVAVAGYRRTDGRPCDYSATGQPAGTTVPPPGRAAPDLALPTDDGAAHFGILAAGASSGSVIALRGTSFAAAAATRLIAEWLKTPATLPSGAAAYIKAAAAAAELSSPFPGATPPAAKIGSGRIRRTHHSRVNRI